MLTTIFVLWAAVVLIGVVLCLIGLWGVIRSRSPLFYYFCNSCRERFYGTRLMTGGTVEEMRRTGWLVLPGNAHYCPCCSKLVAFEIQRTVGPVILPPTRVSSDNPYAV